MGIIRESFIIYSEWDRAIRTAPDDVQLELYHAVMDFAQTGVKPSGLSWQAEMLMTSIETNMKKVIEKYQASIENGKKGGRPAKNTEPSETQQALSETEENPTKPSNNLEKPNETQQNLDEPNPNLNVYVYDNVCDYVIKLVNNKNNIIINKLRERACTREEIFNCFYEKFKDLKAYYPQYREMIDEFFNYMTDMVLQPRDRFKYKNTALNPEEIFVIMYDATPGDIASDINSLYRHGSEIRDVEQYIWACFINTLAKKLRKQKEG